MIDALIFYGLIWLVILVLTVILGAIMGALEALVEALFAMIYLHYVVLWKFPKWCLRKIRRKHGEQVDE